jgi:hypothetical protein
VKHSPDIQARVSRAYTLPLETLDGTLMTFDLPSAGVEWHALPEQFLSSIDFVSRHLDSTVYVSKGKTFAAINGTMAVEHDAGEACPFDLVLTPKEVRAIKSFGSAPTHAFAGAFPGTRQEFRWASGGRLSLPFAGASSSKAEQIAALLDSFDWNHLHEVDAIWRGQVAGHFSFKPVRGESGHLWIHPDRIVSGIFDNRPDTELPIETFADRKVVFERTVFLSVLKVATAIKFVYGDQTHLLFRGENLRGVAIGLREVSS